MYLPPGHPIMSFERIEIKMAAVYAKTFIIAQLTRPYRCRYVKQLFRFNPSLCYSVQTDLSLLMNSFDSTVKISGTLAAEEPKASTVILSLFTDLSVTRWVAQWIENHCLPSAMNCP